MLNIEKIDREVGLYFGGGGGGVLSPGLKHQ